jgi:hypothetical protein
LSYDCIGGEEGSVSNRLSERPPFGTKPKIQQKQVIISQPLLQNSVEFRGVILENQGEQNESLICIFFDKVARQTFLVRARDPSAKIFVVSYDSDRNCVTVVNARQEEEVLFLQKEGKSQSSFSSNFETSFNSYEYDSLNDNDGMNQNKYSERAENFGMDDDWFSDD